MGIGTQKGAIGIVQLIGWGLVLTTTTVGIFWARISSTDSRVDEVKAEQASVLQRTSKLEEAVETIKTDIREIRLDNKEILKELRK